MPSIGEKSDTTLDADTKKLSSSSSFPDILSTLIVTRSPSNSRWSRDSTHWISPPSSPPVLTSHHHIGLSSTGSIALHAGADTKTPAIASTKSENSFRERSTLTIAKHDGLAEINERLDVHKSFGPEQWSFVLAVPSADGGTGVEKFEWRSTTGSETTTLWGSGKGTRGWKLVRMDGSQRFDLSAKGGEERQAGWTRDGKEIVAVWVDDEFKMFPAVVAKFGVLGSGVAGVEGDLGKEWRVMALLSALRMRQIRKSRG
ncbi:hypothetical protein B0A48_10254 [Cryoendolithus antarcticus]|uniref:Uncharacterized protein n=1 Tax=Cryoendolithus antarcticus TaxID=1507870 RepID=A0A1V8SWX4_9PEZI|nr:hypothetical protein B0A48_10254 [Cryoendolithus antarcticus]